MTMKTIRGLAAAGTLALWIAGCEYKVQEPAYYEPHASVPTPAITRLIPDGTAGAGVNTIEVQGENFSATAARNRVYFGKTEAEVVSASPTSLVVRRPNVTGTLAVTVVPFDAISVARFASYTVDTVYELFGGFIEKKQIGAMTVDGADNVYVFLKGTAPFTVYRVDPAGQRTEVGVLTKALTDAVAAPDGQLALFYNNTKIVKLNPQDGVESDWVKLAKKTTTGDFDDNGILYAGGSKSDLYAVLPDGSSKAANVYASQDIKDVQVHGTSVYVLAENAAGTPAVAVWKHAILDAAGNLGPAELVLDRANAGLAATTVLKELTFSADGTLYIGTDAANPVLFMTANGQADLLYKGILPSPAEKLACGSGRYMYMVRGDKWELVRIDLGTR
jgi:hypothetical protein